MKKHLQRYIGWYFLVASIYLMTQEGYGFEGFLIAFLTLLKVPPFDIVGRMFDWADKVSYKWGMKLRGWKEKQTRPVRVIVTIVAIIVILLIWWFTSECELC